MPRSRSSSKAEASLRAQPDQTLRAMYAAMHARYGPQQWWPARTALEVVVGAYLTQNTSWRGVERAIENLEQRGVLTVEGLSGLPEDELRVLIRPSGYMVRKAAAIKRFIEFLCAEADGELETLTKQPTDVLRAKLLALPGVGPETADAILLYALGHPVMVVDEYLRRIATRHGLVPERASYTALQELAAAAFKEDPPETQAAHANEFHALVVQVGKAHCGPQPRCQGCALAGFAAPIPHSTLRR